MIAAKRAVSEEEKKKAGDNSSTGGAKAPGADEDKGRGSKGEELKKDSSSGVGEGGEGSEASDGSVEKEGEGEEEEEWEQVGPKNKSTITRQVCLCVHTCMLGSQYSQDELL